VVPTFDGHPPINIQLINGSDGTPAFVVIPYTEYLDTYRDARGLVPHAVVKRVVGGATPVRAWREHLGLTQAVMAERLGISQSAYAQQEGRATLRKASREKVAAALGIRQELLDI
jgi:ribosome-binding protein aMBF1 (putative translation factor)